MEGRRSGARRTFYRPVDSLTISGIVWCTITVVSVLPGLWAGMEIPSYAPLARRQERSTDEASSGDRGVPHQGLQSEAHLHLNCVS
jgi:hypothetical protein